MEVGGRALGTGAVRDRPPMVVLLTGGAGARRCAFGGAVSAPLVRAVARGGGGPRARLASSHEPLHWTPSRISPVEISSQPGRLSRKDATASGSRNSTTPSK